MSRFFCFCCPFLGNRTTGNSDGAGKYSPLSTSPDISSAYSQRSFPVHSVRVESLAGSWEKYPLPQTLGPIIADDGGDRLIGFGLTGEAASEEGVATGKNTLFTIRCDIRGNFPTTELGSKNPPNDARIGHTLTIHEGKLLSVGGTCWNDSALKDAFISLDLDTCIWKSMRPFWKEDGADCFFNHTATLVYDDGEDREMLVTFGGQLGESCTDAINIYDFVLSEWSRPETTGYAPSKRQLHSAVAHGDKLYVFGGIDDNLSCYNDLHCYDISTGEWMRIHTSGIRPSPRNSHACTICHGSMIIHGGQGSDRKLMNDCFSLDLDTFQWNELRMVGDRPPALYKHNLVPLSDEEFLLLGGKPYKDAEGVYYMTVSEN